MLHVTQRELSSSFNHLNHTRKLKDLRGKAQPLIAFYAAECGLKALILKQEGKATTQELDEGLRSHDLQALVKKLGWSAAKLGSAHASLAYEFEFKDRPRWRGNTVRVPDLHQAHRYGAELKPEDHNRAQEMLNKLCELIQSEADL